MSSSNSSSKLGSSSSISSSFLQLKADLERSKASTSTSTSTTKRKALSFSTDKPAKKKLSSSNLENTLSSSRKFRYYDATPDELDQKRKRKKAKSKPKREDSDAPSSSQLDKIRSNLERKARIYDQLSAGKYAGISTEALKEGSIDWDRKLSEACPRSPSPPPSPTSRLVKGEEEEEEEIEYIDEFGRTRRSKLSEVPRDFLPAKYGGDKRDEEEEKGGDNAIYGPATSFPVYDPGVHRREREEKRRKEEGVHFDADFEKRHYGAAFYRFSKDEEMRKKQMADLGRLRDETREKRGEKGTSGEKE